MKRNLASISTYRMMSYYHLLMGQICLCFLMHIQAQVRCKNDEFQCKGNGVCIDKIHVCDGIQDCRDKSDETENECLHRSCSQKLDYGTDILVLGAATDFKCRYGACISSNFVCDGFTNCMDDSDETKELCERKQCSTEQYKCKYGACIDRYYKCNGQIECVDGSDETKELCLNVRARCNSRQFRCSYGPCIHSKLRCNGKADCADDSDELPSICGEAHTYKSAVTKLFNFVTPKPTESPTQVNHAPPVVPVRVPAGSHPSLGSSANVHDSSNLLKEILAASGYEGDIISGILSAIGEPTIKDIPTVSPEIPVPVLPGHQDSTGHIQPTVLPSFEPGGIIFPGSFNESVTTSAQCEDNLCRCPHPFEFLCVLCQDEQSMESVCSKIGDENVCDILVEEEDTVDILSCGIPYIFTHNVAAYQRDHKEGCLSGDGVPVLTSVLANCWGTTTMILTCQPDGLWYPYDVNDSKKSMSRICQPSGINSQVCGRYQYMKEDTPQFPTNQWPFLVGIFDGPEKFICTGTVISNQWLLTAAHCFPNFNEPSFNISRYQIQHSLSEEMDSLANLTDIYLHPNSTQTSYLANDLALLKLSEALIFSSDLFPVCIDREATLFGNYAATFIRGQDEVGFHWGLSREIIDPSCVNRESVCARHLKIGDTQFCSRKPDRAKQLRPGSSGGPYLVNKRNDNDDQWTIAGVVSHSLNTQSCPDYNVFTSVSMHRDWIDDCVEKENCQ